MKPLLDEDLCDGLAEHQMRDDVRLALAEVYAGAERQDADALIDQLEARGLRVVRA